MICVGQPISVKVCCPNCGSPDSFYQTPGSQFYLLRCTNPTCEMRISEILVEKATHLVLTVSGFRDLEGQPLYPMLADMDGCQVWPAKKVAR